MQIGARLLHNASQLWRDERGTLVSDVAKAAIAIAFLSVIAANVISNQIESNEKRLMASLSSEAGKGRAVDLSSTGSLQSQIRSSQVDPCALPARR
jgi:hypothetical protein